MKQTAKKPWFGPKRWGWGWRPISWQGWLVVLAYIAVILLIARDAKNLGQIKFFAALVGATIVLIVVGYLFGGKSGSESL